MDTCGFDPHPPRMVDNNENKKYPWSDDFEEGLRTGEGIGEYNTYNRVVNAIALGELDLWLEFNAPKSIEGWTEWEEKNGPISEFRTRWDHPVGHVPDVE